jgi:sensor domain CHASE-containing protein
MVYREGFEELEKQTVEKNVNQVTDALSASQDALLTLCYDWAVWDDTYQFAQQYNQDYVDRNFQDETFISSKISLIAVLNSSGKMVYSKAYDLVNSEEIQLPDDLANTFKAEGLAAPAHSENVVAGIMLLTGQPMLVVSRPVLTSLAEGPSAGAIIFGRFLDFEVISQLSETTHLTVNLLPIPSGDSDSEASRIIESLNKSGPTFIQAQNSETIAGYTFVNDLLGSRAFIFKVIVPRDIYQEGLKAITVLHSVLLFIGITFGIVFIFLIRKLVLSRLIKLSNNVNKIGSSGDASGRVNVPGNDELSRLGNNINEMLVSVENANKAMKESEEMLRENNKQLDTVLNSVPCGIIVVDEETHTIHDVNSYASTLIGAPMAEIIGKECHRFLCPTKRGKCPVTHSDESDANAEEIIVNSSADAIPILKNVARVTMGGSRYLLETFIDIT